MKEKVRSLYIASPGYSLLAFDLSQAETWVVAHLANESRMKDALKNSDIHTITAAAIFFPNTECDHPKWLKQSDESRRCETCSATVTYDQRYIGKRSNHGNSYRMSPIRWAQVINAEGVVSVSIAEATKYNSAWLGFYPEITTWWKDIERELALTRTLTTPYHRSRTFGGHLNDKTYKEATAYVPQSTVADHALGLIQPELGIPGGFLEIAEHPTISKYCRIVHTAHDSVMLEVPKNREAEFAPLVYNLFERPLLVNGEVFTIPVDGEWGERWGSMVPIPKEWKGG